MPDAGHAGLRELVERRDRIRLVGPRMDQDTVAAERERMCVTGEYGGQRRGGFEAGRGMHRGWRSLRVDYRISRSSPLVFCSVGSNDKSADEIGCRARREAETVPHGTAGPSNAAWRPSFWKLSASSYL